MKKITCLSIVMALGAVSCLAAGNPLAPTELTLVVTDKSNRVLDTVAVVNDKKSRSVIFQVPENYDEIRVFAVGSRVHQDMPKGYYIKGRPEDKKWWGLGYVEAHIVKGTLVAIDGNGAGPFKLSKAIKAAIKKDLEEAKQAKMTSLKVVTTEEADVNDLAPRDMKDAVELKPKGEPSDALRSAIEKAMLEDQSKGKQ